MTEKINSEQPSSWFDTFSNIVSGVNAFASGVNAFLQSEHFKLIKSVYYTNFFSENVSKKDQTTSKVKTGPLTPEERKEFRRYLKENKITCYRSKGRSIYDREFVNMMMGKEEEI
ncbi:MAG: hypothetical protein AMS24_05470 [Chlamydiae bacterium SM23_39]|nr:MAG: hypothetical protein AMS24_05470 [Chlamydiae bacterium SM23_39]